MLHLSVKTMRFPWSINATLWATRESDIVVFLLHTNINHSVKRKHKDNEISWQLLFKALLSNTLFIHFFELTNLSDLLQTYATTNKRPPSRKTKQGLALPSVIHSRECFHLQPVGCRHWRTRRLTSLALFWLLARVLNKGTTENSQQQLHKLKNGSLNKAPCVMWWEVQGLDVGHVMICPKCGLSVFNCSGCLQLQERLHSNVSGPFSYFT